MNEDTPSMRTTLIQAEFAWAVAFAAALRRYVELTLGHGENLANKLIEIARDSDQQPVSAWDRIFAETVHQYRDYVRELAATPGLATMSFLEQLESTRTGQTPPGQGRDAAGG